jgi:two-component system NtrC family sensor kinase
MGSKGRLTLCTRPNEGGGVLIAISDTGCGISADNLDRLFEPFLTTKEGQGTGLGLSISRGIIENHGGSIWAESTVGQGTTFSVSLPAAELAS